MELFHSPGSTGWGGALRCVTPPGSAKSGKSRQRFDELSTFYELFVYFLHKIQLQSANLAPISTLIGKNGLYSPPPPPLQSAPGAGPGVASPLLRGGVDELEV